MKHTETWEAGMANREFRTITERKLVCKALRTPSNAPRVSREIPVHCRKALGMVSAMLMAEAQAET